MRVIDLSTLSLVGGSGITEVKVPLWWADGTYASTMSNTIVYAQDGTTSTSSSAIPLFTLSSNFPNQFSGMQYALEITGYSSTTANNAIFLLNNITHNSNSPNILVNSTTPTVVRSSQFTIIPGSSFGLGFESNNASSGSTTAYLIDASLIVFPI